MKLRSWLVALALVTVLPLLAFSVVTTVSTFFEHLALVKQALVETARATSLAVDRKVASAIESLGGIAASSEVRGIEDDRQLRSQAERFLASGQDGWVVVTAVAPSGRRLFDVGRPPTPGWPTADEEQFFREAANSRRPIVSDLIGDAGGGSRIVYASAPVIRDNRVEVVLVAGLSASMVAEPLQREQMPRDRTAVLLDRRKVIIARSKDGERLVGAPAATGMARGIGDLAEGSFKEVDVDDTPVYVGFHRSGLTGWTVAVGLPTAVVNRPLWNRLATVALVGLGLVVVGMIGSWWFERRIRMPIVALSNAAEALAGGRPARPMPTSSIVEIASLARSIAYADTLLRERAQGWEQAEAELAEEREQFRVTLASIGDAVIATDMFGRVTFMNDVARSLTGWADEPATGHPLDSVLALFDEETGSAIDSPFSRVIHEEPIAPVGQRTVLRTRGGTDVPVECRGAPRRDASGRTVGTVFVCRDSSERRRAERERADILARAHAARDDAEAANRAKDEFIAMLGHELRNPLGAISNAVYVLDLIGSPAAPAVQARQIISRAVSQLVRMVDDLLDVARVTRGKVMLNHQPVNVADCATQCLSSLSAAGKSSRHRITVDVEPAWVDGDPFRIEQIITNLVNNAIQYTPADGAIHVAVGASGDDVVVRVKDTGIGISAAMLPRVFDLFAQGNRTLDRPQGGLGIGLTLARTLVEAHGGTIEAASEGLGQGSEFTVRLPRIPGPSPEPESSPAPLPPPPSRILIVEDSQDARDMLRIFLAQSGHQVFEAADGPSAVEAAHRAHPDVALIDIGLPGLDGFEVARQIRTTVEGKRMLLVALTGYGQPRDQQHAHEAGFDAYLVKPFDRDRLSTLLATDRRQKSEEEMA